MKIIKDMLHIVLQPYYIGNLNIKLNFRAKGVALTT